MKPKNTTKPMHATKRHGTVQPDVSIGLCNRCNYRHEYAHAPDRARVHRPRCECGDIGSQTCGCYMFSPIKPLVLRPAPGEKRSVAGPAMWRGRSRSARVAIDGKDIVPRICYLRKGEYILYWLPVKTAKRIERLMKRAKK